MRGREERKQKINKQASKRASEQTNKIKIKQINGISIERELKVAQIYKGPTQ